MTDKKLKQILEGQREEYQRYIDVIYEKFRNDVQIIGEGWQISAEKINKMSTKVETIEKQMGQLTMLPDKVEKLSKKVATIEKKVEMTGEKTDQLVLGFDLVGSKVDRMSRKLDATFEMTGQIKEELGDKVDRPEFEDLKKRALLR